jgi:hypothetical protein
MVSVHCRQTPLLLGPWKRETSQWYGMMEENWSSLGRQKVGTQTSFKSTPWWLTFFVLTSFPNSPFGYKFNNGWNYKLIIKLHLNSAPTWKQGLQHISLSGCFFYTNHNNSVDNFKNSCFSIELFPTVDYCK